MESSTRLARKVLMIHNGHRVLKVLDRVAIVVSGARPVHLEVTCPKVVLTCVKKILYLSLEKAINSVQWSKINHHKKGFTNSELEIFSSVAL
jgi:hypothetical protein